jgi:hypothetical protein
LLFVILPIILLEILQKSLVQLFFGAFCVCFGMEVVFVEQKSFLTNGLNAYHVSEDFDLPARLLLIQKSQAEAAEVGKKIYEAVLNDDIEEKERLLKEYNRLINQGNLHK